MRAFVFATAALWTAASIAQDAGPMPQAIAIQPAAADPAADGAATDQPVTAQAATTTVAAPIERPLYQQPHLFQMLQRSNGIRRRHGLTPHRMNPILCQAAQDQAHYMARTGQFDHYVNDGPQWRARKYGFRSGVWEILALNGNSVDVAFQQWTVSPKHYETIVVRHTTDAGFGYAVNSQGWGYFVGVYGISSGEAVSQSEEELAATFATEKGAPEEQLADK